MTISRYPTKDELVNTFWKLYESHPKKQLPLESNLPEELKPKYECKRAISRVGQNNESIYECSQVRSLGRDDYRIALTMILSPGMEESHLVHALARLFKRYPDFESMKGINEEQARIILSPQPEGAGFGRLEEKAIRLSTLVKCYFNIWNKQFTWKNIHMLLESQYSQFGEKVVETLKGYLLGDLDALPLDGPAFDNIRKINLFGHSIDYSGDVYEVRDYIKEHLTDIKGIHLIDFHEMLRYDEQASKLWPGGIRTLQKAWNAWRLLSSTKWSDFRNNKNDCIYSKLIKDDALFADDLYKYYCDVLNKADIWA